MELEFALEGVDTEEAYDFEFREGPRLERVTVDWAPVVEALVADVRSGVSAGVVSARFHNGLVETIVQVAKRAGLERVVLSGGCFQNRYLAERSVRRLRDEGFRPYWHQRIPPNDGGIALGQLVAAVQGMQ
jgi:hydrogenase maturation protein HypF